jgi:hypothetical protein
MSNDQYRDLHEALSFLNPDDYNFWINCGIALKRFGNRGFGLWSWWSSSYGNYSPAEIKKKWSTFNPFDEGGIHYESILDAAEKAGWINPWKMGKRDKASGVGADYVPANEIDYDINSLSAVEYGVDGYSSTGLTIIAGETGLGKTSAVVPLACLIAHIIGNLEDPFTLNPVLRRKIVFVTEDSGQVKRLLYGIKKHQTELTSEEIKEWFHIVDAKRKTPAQLAADVESWRSQYGYEAGPELARFWIEPLIIIDTANSNIDLENENSNSEVGAAIALIKQRLGESGMVWLIAHLTKALKRADVASLSARGAGAWEADSNASIYLTADENLPGKRFLVLGKRRFEPDFKEIEITSETHTEFTQTQWGKLQTQTYRTSSLLGLRDGSGMKSQVKGEKDKKMADEVRQILTEAYNSIGPDEVWKGLSANAILTKIGGKAKESREALARVARCGEFQFEVRGSGEKAGVYYWLKGQIVGKS